MRTQAMEFFSFYLALKEHYFSNWHDVGLNAGFTFTNTVWQSSTGEDLEEYLSLQTLC
jgi:hypothetical protein